MENIIKHSHYDTIILDAVFDSEDSAFAYCIQNNLLQTNKDYNFISYPLAQKKTLIVFVAKEKIKSIGLPEIFLPLGLREHFIHETLFCFDDFLIAFHHKKIIYYQKCHNLPDLLLALETLQKDLQINIQTIYSNKKYNNIPIQQEEFNKLDPVYPNTLYKECYKNYPLFLFCPQPKFYQQSLFYFLTFNIALILMLILGVSIFKKNILELERQTTNLSPTLKNYFNYYPKYYLIHKILNLAASNSVHFENLEILSQNNDFFILLDACHPDESMLTKWLEKMQNLLSVFYKNIALISNNPYYLQPYYCKKVSWQQ